MQRRLITNISRNLKRYVHSSKRFDLETKLIRRDGVAHDGSQHFNVTLTDNWSIGDAPNGGYMMYIAIKAAQLALTDHSDPLTFTAYYTSKAIENIEAELSVRLLTKSKSTSTVHVTLKQEGTTRSEYFGVLGKILDDSKSKGVRLNDLKPPQLQNIEECFDMTKVLRKTFGGKLKICNQMQVRVPKQDPFVTGLFAGKRGTEAKLSAWAKFEDDRIPCVGSLAFFADALPPPITNVSHTSWVPTFEYTVHFWTKPEQVKIMDPELRKWVQTTFHTPIAKNGWLYCDGEVWSPDGSTILASTRQFAKLLEPRN